MIGAAFVILQRVAFTLGDQASCSCRFLHFAGGDFVLLMFGLAVSIPLMIFGSTLMIKLMERYPWIVPTGTPLIGWVAGETIVGDHSLAHIHRSVPCHQIHSSRNRCGAGAWCGYVAKEAWHRQLSMQG